MENYDKNQFRSNDLSLSATLVAFGYSVEAIERATAGRATFIFARQDGLDNVIQSYWAKNLTVEPRTLLDAVKHLKTMLYSEVS